jgi:hypothetical protein
MPDAMPGARPDTRPVAVPHADFGDPYGDNDYPDAAAPAYDDSRYLGDSPPAVGGGWFDNEHDAGHIPEPRTRYAPVPGAYDYEYDSAAGDQDGAASGRDRADQGDSDGAGPDHAESTYDESTYGESDHDQPERDDVDEYDRSEAPEAVVPDDPTPAEPAHPADTAPVADPTWTIGGISARKIALTVGAVVAVSALFGLGGNGALARSVVHLRDAATETSTTTTAAGTPGDDVTGGIALPQNISHADPGYPDNAVPTAATTSDMPYYRPAPWPAGAQPPAGQPGARNLPDGPVPLADLPGGAPPPGFFAAARAADAQARPVARPPVPAPGANPAANPGAPPAPSPGLLPSGELSPQPRTAPRQQRPRSILGSGGGLLGDTDRPRRGGDDGDDGDGDGSRDRDNGGGGGLFGGLGG